jgi:sugar/nucleoside kinase (ribokinase family)
MPPAPPSTDLLIVGGLTVDRFEEGATAPGGSAMHATRAAVHAGLRVGVLTVAGDESTARRGLDELRELGVDVEAVGARDSITYRHRETPTGRRLWLERRSGHIDRVAAHLDARPSRSVLFAPVADELPAPSLPQRHREIPAGAILQGWLRATAADGEVRPIPPADLGDSLVTELRRLGVLVASREDLLASADQPTAQLDALRVRLGEGPLLIVTDGPEGAWLDDGSAGGRWHLPVPWRVEGVPMVGAGDALAAVFVAAWRQAAMPDAYVSGAGTYRRSSIDTAAQRAMREVSEMLESRRT